MKACDQEGADRVVGEITGTGGKALHANVAKLAETDRPSSGTV